MRTTNLLNAAGQKHGLWVAYNGRVQYKQTYKNDLLDGPYEYYYESGVLWTTGNYKDGKHEGLWKSYFSTGKLVKIIHYEKGNVRYIKYYDEDEIVCNTIYYAR
jgi:uncharacterized protein